MAKMARNRSGRTASALVDGVLRSPASLIRMVFHGFLCIAALILGFRLSGEAVFFIGTSSKGTLFLTRGSGKLIEGIDVALRFPYIPEARQSPKPPAGSEGRTILDGPATPFSDSRTGAYTVWDGRTTLGSDGHITIDSSRANSGGHTWLPLDINQAKQGRARVQPPPPGMKSSRVHVGRHEILIRPRPHPDPLQTIKAHKLMDLVQHEQKLLYGSDEQRQLLVITPTFARTFQALHLMCLINTLRIAPSALIWIVIEAGGMSNETAALLSSSQLPYYHLGLPESMPALWEERRQLEVRLRAEGLRFIREQQLDGIVLFVDDSNTYSLDFFKEAQKTKWIGAFSIGLLPISGLLKSPKRTLRVARKEGSSSLLSLLPLQGPACDSTEHIVGWYMSMNVENGPGTQDQRSLMHLEWAGFSLNARLLWEDHETPVGFRSWNEVFDGIRSSIQSPLEFVQNTSLVEPLGNCGRDVLLWWLRVEARADSRFPSRWVIDPHLEIVVPSKQTPWPDPPLKRNPLPSDVVVGGHEKHRAKQSARGQEKRRFHHEEKIKQSSDSHFQ